MRAAVELTDTRSWRPIVALAAVALLAIWFVPRHQATRWAQQGMSGKDLVELENGARAALVQLVGGVALILTFVATWTQISDTRKATDRTLRLTAAQQEWSSSPTSSSATTPPPAVPPTAVR